MSLKSFVFSGMLAMAALPSSAQRAQRTTQADLSYLFLEAIEQGRLSPKNIVGINIDGVPYNNCQVYDFPLVSGKVSLYYCPTYKEQVVVDYSQNDDKSKNWNNTNENNMRTQLYSILGSDSISLDLYR